MTRDERIEANLDLPWFHGRWIYRRIRRRIPLDDLVQAGMLGLVRASAAFDESRGIAFRTYADRRVRGCVIDLIRSETKSRNGERRGVFIPFETAVRAGLQVPDQRLTSPEVQVDLARVWQLMARLPQRMQRIVELYYGNADLTDAQIGLFFGVSEGRVNQLRHEALERLRKLSAVIAA